MSVSLILDGDPDGCQSAATALRALADTLDDGAEVAATVRGRSADAWRSPAGDRLRAVCSEHLASCDLLRGTSRELALRLSALATALSEVAAELKRAQAIARKAGIVADATLPTFEEAQPTRESQAAALDHALAVVARARQIEAEAHADYAAALPALQEALTPPPPAEAPGQKGMLSTLTGLLPDLSAPNLPSLPDLSDLPDLPALPKRPDLPDLPKVEMPDLSRLAPLAEPGLAAGGALAGLALCARARLPAPLMSACAEAGSSAGSWIARKLTER